MTEEKNTQKEENEGGIFTCELCNLSENYNYKGKNPPFSKHIKFLEECYTMKDPFSPPDKHQFLIIGSNCTLCSKSVCQSTECSFFYEKRYCLPCALNNLTKFPEALRIKLQKLNSSKQ